ncbi:hypothetical protein IG631_11732 [Alternaria alternata]|nr:hypothetical protein IG631_11732 [Alternaria alternata]
MAVDAAGRWKGTSARLCGWPRSLCLAVSNRSLRNVVRLLSNGTLAEIWCWKAGRSTELCA